MRFNIQGWQILQRIIVFALFISLWLISFNHGLIQNMQYIFYLVNEKKYEIVQAEILDIEKKDFFIKRDRVALTVTRIEIFYQVGAEEYINYIYSYPDMIDKEMIKVGINLKSPRKVIRCVPYALTEYEKEVYKEYFLIVVVIFFLFTIINICLKNLFTREI